MHGGRRSEGKHPVQAAYFTRHPCAKHSDAHANAVKALLKVDDEIIIREVEQNKNGFQALNCRKNDWHYYP